MPTIVDGSLGVTYPVTAGGTSAVQASSSKVLQVVQGVYSTSTTSSSSTFADTGLTASITPSSSSSKILVIVTQTGCGKESNNTDLQLRLFRGSTNIAEIERFGGFNNGTGSNFIGTCSICYLDSPATTSSTTYKTQMASRQNLGTVYTQVGAGGIPSTSTITLMEIAA